MPRSSAATALACFACVATSVLWGPLSGIARAGSWLALAPDAQNGTQQVTPIDLGTAVAQAALTTTGAESHLGVAISPDARTAYVVSAGSHELVPIDLTTDPAAVGAPVDLTGSPAPASTRVPAYIAISPDGDTAFVSDPVNDQIVVVNLTTSPVTLGTPIDLPAGAKPHGIAFAPDGTSAYVADYGTGQVSPIDVATGTAQTPISVGIHPDQIAVTPDGRKAYVTDNGSSDVYPIALPSGTVGTPISVGAGLTPLGIAISPDGSTAWTANFGAESSGNGSGDTVTPIALSNDSAGSPITVGGGPWSIAVAPDSKTVYVGNSNDATVTPIDAATRTAGAPIAGVPFARSLAITPDQAPVANFTVTSGAPGQATSFDASASTARFGSIVSYTWSFGDGTPAVTTTSPTTSHVYSTAGSYTATVSETSVAGTSTTGEVYTGQTASSVGGSSALAMRTVIVSSAPQPAVTLSVSSLAFGTLGVGKTAAAQSVTVTD
ncbi:MAG: PKD domain-containing protein, partial [Solirubrobacteraceae bacterium]